MKHLAIALVSTLSIAGRASAQAPVAPPAEEPEPRMRLDAGLIAGVPQGDFAGEVSVDGNTVDIEAATSPGIHLQFGYRMTDTLGLLVGLRYISVQSDNLSDSGIDLASYDVELGGRFSRPISPMASFFGEAMLIRSTVDFSVGGNSMSYSDIGFGARAGLTYRASHTIDVGGSLGYSTAQIKGYTAAWLGLEGFVSFRL
jgi:hypothetical protein